MPQPDRVLGRLRFALTPAEAAQELAAVEVSFDKHIGPSCGGFGAVD